MQRKCIRVSGVDDVPGETVIERITIFGGCSRNGVPEPVGEVELKMGDVVSIVGPTGSGKTTLINDMELFADGTTPTRRRILIDGVEPLPEYREDPSHNPIALITQHTNFLSDLPVREFLTLHAHIRNPDDSESKTLVKRTLDFANQLTGEPVVPQCRMTELSGGQTRALLIADAAVISNAPIILLDEIENAGINCGRAIELLRQSQKIYVFVTHEPYISLMSDFRLVMRDGAMVELLKTSSQEKTLLGRLSNIERYRSNIRERIRRGEHLTVREMEKVL
jgi:ABC-type lipoprotein export system ATPase subunit